MSSAEMGCHKPVRRLMIRSINGIFQGQTLMMRVIRSLVDNSVVSSCFCRARFSPNTARMPFYSGSTLLSSLHLRSRRCLFRCVRLGFL